MDQETVLRLFGIEDPSNRNSNSFFENSADLKSLTIQQSPNVSLNTFKFLFEGLWEKVQDGLTLADIENVLFFILFIRFIILVFRYNLLTSFLITCIGLVAGYLWYRHLIDLITMYRTVLLKLPFLHKLGIDAVQLRQLNRSDALMNLTLGENGHWYNPGAVLYYAFVKGVIHIDPETGFRYYIDPISMIISNLPESIQAKIIPGYYHVYQKVIPRAIDICSKFWSQLSGIGAYTIITRMGKRYCPYLIRWHWTFLLIIGMIEQTFVYLIYRIYYFQVHVLIPKTTESDVDPTIFVQINFLNLVLAGIVLTHIGFVLFALFHAVCGQYFYLPFFVKNTELHIGPRPANSVYSSGQTAWQDPEEKEGSVTKLWYGWFGRGTRGRPNLFNFLKRLLKKVVKKIKKN